MSKQHESQYQWEKRHSQARRGWRKSIKEHKRVQEVNAKERDWLAKWTESYIAAFLGNRDRLNYDNICKCLAIRELVHGRAATDAELSAFIDAGYKEETTTYVVPVVTNYEWLSGSRQEPQRGRIRF